MQSESLATNVHSLCWMARQNANDSENGLVHARQINTAALHGSLDEHMHAHTHKQSQGLLSHKLCIANLFRGIGDLSVRFWVCLCVCARTHLWVSVCSLLDRVSLMTQSPAFSAQNSVSSAFTKAWAIRSKPPGPTQRPQCSTSKDNSSILSVTYIPAHFLIESLSVQTQRDFLSVHFAAQIRLFFFCLVFSQGLFTLV